MTTFYAGYRNYLQPQFTVQQDKKAKEEKAERENNQRERLPENNRKDLAEDIEAFLARFRTLRNTLKQRPNLREQLLEQLASYKLEQNKALRKEQLTFYQTSSEQARLEIRSATQRLAQLMQAQNELEQADTRAIKTNFTVSVSAVVKETMPEQTTIRSMLPEMNQENAPQNATLRELPESIPLQPYTATEKADKATYATEGAKDDITSIGQDKMTPEEKFWHELSIVMAGGNAELQKIISEVQALINLGTSISKNEFQAKLKAIHARLDNFINNGGPILPVPEGLSKAQVEDLLKKAGVSYEFNDDGSVKLKGIIENDECLTRARINMAALIRYMDNETVNMEGMVEDVIVFVITPLREFFDNFPPKEIMDALNKNYPYPEIPESDDSSLSGWLQGMLPAFDSIDKSNVNFYKSLISLITSWQSKINEFNAKYAEVLKNSGGVDQNDGKHRFDIAKVNEMLSLPDDISVMEHQMALILGGITETDLQNLLEGTGINYTAMVGTVALVNIGSDVVKMLKEAVQSAFSETKDKKYLVTPEQLAQFNSVLTQVQTQFDTVVKKVNTKTESAKSLFNDTREALSNLIKTYESLLADLAKMIR